jgi:hypothetical protein
MPLNSWQKQLNSSKRTNKNRWVTILPVSGDRVGFFFFLILLFVSAFPLDSFFFYFVCVSIDFSSIWGISSIFGPALLIHALWMCIRGIIVRCTLAYVMVYTRTSHCYTTRAGSRNSHMVTEAEWPIRGGRAGRPAERNHWIVLGVINSISLSSLLSFSLSPVCWLFSSCLSSSFQWLSIE